MSKQEFIRGVDKVNALLRTVKSDLHDRDRLRALNTNTLKIEARIRKQLSDAGRELDNLFCDIEVDKRRQKVIKDLELQMAACKKELILEKSATSLEAKLENVPESELWSLQTEMRQKIESLGDTVHNLKDLSEDIEEEIDMHLQLLSDMDESVSKNQSQVEKALGKMKQLVQLSTDSCLLCTIFGLLVFLILLAVYV